MKDYIVYYVVETYDGNETREEAGFVPASGFAVAMTRIENYYGNELAVVKHLELLDISMLTMSVDCATRVLDEIY